MSQSTHNTDYQLLLSILKAARKRVGVSQVELAERLENTQTFVSKCERGERRIDAVELVEFAEALGVPPLGVLRVPRAAEPRAVPEEQEDEEPPLI